MLSACADGLLDEGVVEPEDFAELLVVHVGEPGFARAHGHVRDGLLCLEKRVDFFFERSLGDEPVDLHVARLPDTEGAVGGLRFDGGVPPQVVMDDLRCGGEVEARTARLEREDEHLAFGVLLEVLDHGGALRLRASAVVEVRAEPEFLRDGLFEQESHLGELREDERLFALFLNGGEQVEEHLHFAGGKGRRRFGGLSDLLLRCGCGSLQECRGVVAYLLEGENHLQYDSLALE